MRTPTNILSIGLVVLLLSMFTTGCKKDDVTPELETGIISGTVYSANGQHAIPNANVFVDAAGEIYLTRTGNNGAFTLEVPVGTQTLHIQSGNGQLFRSSTQVEVAKGQTVQVDATQSKLNQVASLAYVSGTYDQIEAIITNLGYTATAISTSDLDDLNLISNYNAIFLNCGYPGLVSSNAYQNLGVYVSNGGSLYTSDWAVAALGGCSYPGGFIPVSSLCTSRSGSSGWVMGASVLNTDIQTAIADTIIDIDFDLGSWERISTYDPNVWEVLVNDSQSGNGPLLIRTNKVGTAGSGNPVGINDPNFVTICHYPPGNPSNPVTITINVNALNTHLAHGDVLGPCSNSPVNGTIYYTTFHNHPNGGVGSDIEAILEYMILNL